MTRGRRFESRPWHCLVISEMWPYFAGKLSWDITTTHVNSALHPSGVAKSSTKLHTGLMCTSLISFHSRRSPLCSSWRPRRPSHQTSSWQPGILRRWSCAVEQSADRYSTCTNSLYFQESTQDSFVFTVVFCTLSFINLIRVAYMLYGALVVTLRTCYGAI